MMVKPDSKPIISIIVPVYNCEKYIAKCVESIIGQTFVDWELLLIDDGSKDNSPQICDKFAAADNRIRTIHKTNGGASSARNRGIDEAAGDYITFIDSDDWVDPEYLQKFLDKQPDQNTIVYSGIISHIRDRKFVYFHYEDCEFTIPSQSEIIRNDLLQDGGPVNKLFPRKLLIDNNLRFNEQLHYHEDHIFVYNVLLFASKLKFSSYCGYHYIYYDVWSGNSLSHVASKNVAGLLYASDLFLEILPRLFNHLGITNHQYKNKATTRTGYSQRLLAMAYAYGQQMPDSDLKRILCEEKNKLKQYKYFYTPKSRKRSLLIGLLSLPMPIAHIGMKLIARKFR